MTAAGGDASFSDLAVKIVTSRQFRNRQGGRRPTALDDREVAGHVQSTAAVSIR